MTVPSSRTVLQLLPKVRLLELGRMFAIALPPSGSKDEQVEALVARNVIRSQDVLGALGRDELKLACRSHGLYNVALRRLEPVGLVFLWPETRG